ncbi:MAG: PIG-L family deacetylase [Oscillospiraceae bacterium]|nr:PIG-L family deacetylase [Oscillospiraceae bacterium]
MKRLQKILALVLVLCLALPAYGIFATDEAVQAEDITASTTISGTGYDSFGFLKNGNIDTYRTSSGNASIKLENGKGIASLYLYFDLEYGEYTITDNTSGNTVTAGQYGILHEFVDLEGLLGSVPTSVTLNFNSGKVRLSEIYSFTSGQTPDFVQKWQAPLDGGADIVLFSTHSDDDQLFFAGLVPLYAGEKKCRVQVVLLTDHRKGPYATNGRTHEVLNGLWATGLTAYPVFGDFVDYLLEDLNAMYRYYESIGTSKEEMQSFVVEQIRRFKPQVAIGHDLKGEYKHGMHMVYADLLVKALDMTADATVFPESADKYGTWDVPKTYLHLYEENKIVIDYDVPLDSFDGLTAFQASQKLGYPCHKSQQWTWFTRWLNGSGGNKITKATEIETYNPAHFGLYRSTVGEDVQKNDFLENIVTYAEQERLDKEAADAVAAQIEAIGTVTLDSRAAIEAARAAYDALNDTRKALVTNSDVLTAAEEALAQLEAEKAAKDAADKAAADAVIGQIEAIGSVTLESGPAIQNAEDAYAALTEDQKALVNNAGKLTEARAELEALQFEEAKQEQEDKTLRNSLIILAILVVALIAVLSLLIRRTKPKRRRK